MKLADWLSSNGIKPSHFAQTLGVEASTVSRLLNGERKPSGDLLIKIRRETKNKVDLEDFFGEVA